ncbi:MAG: hypothetical protein M1829_001735 [Trizodia sp. TS-e1964]|nr:MAG: hypothetical protein M1829_001735 [Trizodia sp. TS-e1964]
MDKNKTSDEMDLNRLQHQFSTHHLNLSAEELANLAHQLRLQRPDLNVSSDHLAQLKQGLKLAQLTIEDELFNGFLVIALGMLEDAEEEGRSINLQRIVCKARDRIKLSFPTKPAVLPSRDGETVVTDKSGKPKRRLTLMPTEAFNQAQPKARRPLPNTAYSYLGNAALHPNDIFYGSSIDTTAIVGTRNPQNSPTSTSHEDDWSYFQPPRLPTGARLVVLKKLHHFFRNARPIRFYRNSQSFIGISPYLPHLLVNNDQASFTLYPTTPGHPSNASKQLMINWPEYPSTQTGQQHRVSEELAVPEERKGLPGKKYEFDGDDLEALERWKEMEDDHVLPLLGDSGSENDYNDSLWEDMEQEQEEQRNKLAKLKDGLLTTEEVESAIKEAIAGLVEKWKQTKLPKRQLKAWSVWTKSRKKNTKRQQISEAQGQVLRIDKRIDKISLEIRGEEWTKPLQVIKQCLSMEQSINDRQDLLWTIGVLERRTEPSKETTVPRSRPVKKAVSKPASEQADDDVELIESESDQGQSSLDNADMSKFIVRDDIGYENDADMVDAEDISDNQDFHPIEDSLGTSLFVENKPQGISSHVLHSSDVVENIIDLTAGQSDPSDLEETKNDTRTSEKRIASPPADILDEDLPSTTLPALSTKLDKKTKAYNPFAKKTLSDGTTFVGDFYAKYHPNQHLLKEQDDPTKTEVAKKHQAGDFAGLWETLLSKINPSERSLLIKRFSLLPIRDLWSELSEALSTMQGGQTRVRGWDSLAFNELQAFALMYARWYTGEYRTFVPHNKKDCKILITIIEDKKKFNTFYHKVLKPSIANYVSPELPADTTPKIPSKTTARKISPQDKDTPNKKRKIAVPENRAAIATRNTARERIKEQDERRRVLEKQLLESGTTSTENPDRIIINPSKLGDQNLIYINNRIGRKIKKHQIDGVQFMWRETVLKQGCLLAHTMGLGKTMQVITLLVTIAESANSSDTGIFSQIPDSLKTSKTLILCPPTLIENWWDEFLMWAPMPTKDNVGTIRKVDTSFKVQARLSEIAEWYYEGGILIMSYDIFRALVMTEDAEDSKGGISSKQLIKARKRLLEGPNIVVADEAHKMKNPTSRISLATQKFKTTCRIALTGSPLANSLMEYYSMIDWIAKDFLGSIVDFKSYYLEPIEEGLWMESSGVERRTSLKKLKALKTDLEPKVHRRDISVLKSDLKPKIEFLIKVPLTMIQRSAYLLFVQHMYSSNANRITNVKLLSWLSTLGLLCNHPQTFYEKMKDLRSPPQSEGERSQADPEKARSKDLGISADLVKAELDFFESYERNLRSSRNSYRTVLFEQILDASKDANDKVLVFSHSLLTLDFLNDLLIKKNRKFLRMDGSTKMSDRQNSSKEFNTSNEFDIYLISTRAGGLGLNFFGANRVVIFDFNFNPTWEEQAVGRSYRIGQPKPVFVYRFIAGGTYEEVVHNKAVFKMQLSTTVVDEKNIGAKAVKNFKEYLFEPKTVEKKDLSEFRGLDPLVLDKILDLHHPIHSIELDDSFRRDVAEKLTVEEELEAARFIQEQNLRRTDKSAYDKMMAERSCLYPTAPTRNLAASQPTQLDSAGQMTTQVIPTNFAYTSQPISQHFPGEPPPTTVPGNLSHSNVAKPALPGHGHGQFPILGANTKIKESKNRRPFNSEDPEAGHSSDSSDGVLTTNQIPDNENESYLTIPVHNSGQQGNPGEVGVLAKPPFK